MGIGRIAIHQVSVLCVLHGLAEIKSGKRCACRAAMPNLNSLRERYRRDWRMRAARCGHVAIRLSETHNAAITASAEKKKISPVRCRIVSRLDLFIPFGLSHRKVLFVPLGVPLNQCLRAVVQCLPYLNQRTERIRPRADGGCNAASTAPLPRNGS